MRLRYLLLTASIMLFSTLCSAQDSLQLANHHTKESSDSVIVNQLKEKALDSHTTTPSHS